MSEGFVGHVSDDKQREQSLICHLNGVAELAAQFAEEFGAAGWGRLVGMAHDIGKYSPEAQRRMRGEEIRVDHSTAGGQTLINMKLFPLAYAVMGHHGGLPNGGSCHDSECDPTVFGRKIRQIPNFSAFESEVTLSPPGPLKLSQINERGFSWSFFIRMLFSCLVDADFLDTEAFMQQNRVKRGGHDSIQVLYERLNAYIADRFNNDNDLNLRRTQIREACLAKALSEKGLFSLTVPTGGGKTIISLAFALKHALQHGLRRVIYVIPYTSIIDQTAKEFKCALGNENVLEHHSGVNYDNDKNDGEEKPTKETERDWRHLASENWDAPIVVTTNVQFFESLFAARTSRCRKLHNIAGSVIVFDEAQMLPISLLQPCVAAIAELCHNYGCTSVLCTATQPALDGLFPSGIARAELVDDPRQLYEEFRRVRFNDLGPQTDEQLAERLQEHEQALCIVATRAQAQNVYKLLAAGGEEKEGVFHLSTLMTPAHRREVLAVIRERLGNQQKCVVTATSLVEAGVDLDFPTVYRARAGLDSVIQAAGRCNRENKRPASESVVHVFDPVGYKVPQSQSRPIDVMRVVAHKFEDIASPEAIEYYFKLLYTVTGRELDKSEILPKLEESAAQFSFPFREVADLFKVIKDGARGIVVADEFGGAEAIAQLRTGDRSRETLREAALHTVNVYAHTIKEFRDAGIIEALDSEKFGELYALTDLQSYTRVMGLLIKVETGFGLEA